jgi:hypothetical protein
MARMAAFYTAATEADKLATASSVGPAVRS